ncbi:uncharacterized protein LOC110100885 isoform X1 [Dendrobium catenatum]|uniref:Folate receptor-like domain-containing protein n=1 Tax=Dendrobium catenatum TaxID=906689 RepID=A0A2I0VYK1_9ASPA|nr:uncharacterized protein LOC110100885 isoform X1 [Dendrobium catenatum]PKU68459.1 hypothetical protein MA16_Dca016817 [Dendrobium catenatum]
MVLVYRASMFLEIFATLFLFAVLNRVSAGQSGGLCISPGGHFHPFLTEGKPPRKVTKGPRDLAVCRVFRQNTCCDVVQTYRVLEFVRRLASFGEASQECLHAWELLECSVCDPLIGVQPGPPLICASFCNMILQDCSSAYFSIDPRNKVLSPCGLGDIICGRASEWASNGTELCHLAGFAVKQDVFGNHDVDKQYCYGGKASVESISSSWKASRSVLSMGEQPYGVLEDFQQWFRKLPVNEKVKWAIGGMVLTSGLLYMSKRKSYSQRRKQAAALRMARKMDSRINHSSSSIRR